MLRIASFAAAILIFAHGAPEAEAYSSEQPSSLIAMEYAATLPPVGQVGYCAKNPKECRPEHTWIRRIHLSPEKWASIVQINKNVNTQIVPVSDKELYGQSEFWTIPTDAGDCEDVVLLKRQKLQQLGFPTQGLRITVVLDEVGEGHAVLTITTFEGDFVLDNRRSEVLLWRDTGYTFLKRQSARDPMLWVSLVKDGTGAGRFLNVGSDR